MTNRGLVKSCRTKPHQGSLLSSISQLPALRSRVLPTFPVAGRRRESVIGIFGEKHFRRVRQIPDSKHCLMLGSKKLAAGIEGNTGLESTVPYLRTRMEAHKDAYLWVSSHIQVKMMRNNTEKLWFNSSIPANPT